MTMQNLGTKNQLMLMLDNGSERQKYNVDYFHTKDKG